MKERKKDVNKDRMHEGYKMNEKMKLKQNATKHKVNMTC